MMYLYTKDSFLFSGANRFAFLKVSYYFIGNIFLPTFGILASRCKLNFSPNSVVTLGVLTVGVKSRGG